jgi:uncharacterized protein YfkK (UPF0435 family)
MSKKTDREKEIKLIHLDAVQREILCDILDRFTENKKTTPKEAVEAFVSYIIYLVEGSASGAKHFCDDLGNISVDSTNHIQKFVDALRLCSGCAINHYKILNTIDIRNLLAKAAASRNRATMQHINELEYKLKIICYSLLDTDDMDLENYMQDTEDTYISSLTSINPIMMKNAFIEHVVDMMATNDDSTLSDITNLAKKYSKYLGTEVLTEEVVEGLIQKYNDIEKYRDSGLVHAARIEVFKILEGGAK